MKKVSCFLLGIFLFSNISCTDECAKSAIPALADLITKAIGLYTGAVQVNVGTIVDIAMTIENLKDVANVCGLTDAASESNYDLTFLFKPDGKSEWDTIGTAKYGADEIAAGFTYDDVIGFEFLVPGEYDIVGYSDTDDNVEERNENNNDKNAGSINGTKNGTSYFIKVVNPEKSTIEKHEEAIPYIRPIKTDNLIEFNFKETYYY